APVSTTAVITAALVAVAALIVTAVVAVAVTVSSAATLVRGAGVGGVRVLRVVLPRRLLVSVRLLRAILVVALGCIVIAFAATATVTATVLLLALSGSTVV